MRNKIIIASEEELKKLSEKFDIIEGRASVFYEAKEIAWCYPSQAAKLLLSTWHRTAFQYVMQKPAVMQALRETASSLTSIFSEIKDLDFRTADFSQLKPAIERFYAPLSSIEGVGPTGAAKVSALYLDKLIVMWDTPIREFYQCGSTLEDFIAFQKQMQANYKNFAWEHPYKTLAKVIDEANYVKITIPHNEKEKEKREEAKLKKQKAKLNRAIFELAIVEALKEMTNSANQTPHL